MMTVEADSLMDAPDDDGVGELGATATGASRLGPAGEAAGAFGETRKACVRSWSTDLVVGSGGARLAPLAPSPDSSRDGRRPSSPSGGSAGIGLGTGSPPPLTLRMCPWAGPNADGRRPSLKWAARLDGSARWRTAGPDAAEDERARCEATGEAGRVLWGSGYGIEESLCEDAVDGVRE